MKPASSGHPGAVGAAVERAVSFDVVADHLDPAVLARRGERVDRALEAIEGVCVASGHGYLKRLGVRYTVHKHTHPYRGCRKMRRMSRGL